MLMPDPYEVLGEPSFNVRKLLDKVYENPRIVVWANRNAADSPAQKALEYSLCNQFYVNLIDNGKYEYDLLRVLAEALKVRG